MSDWTDLDLPVPEVPAYGYSVDAGLQRTPFTTAKPRQRRKHETNRRNFAVEVLLTQAQLDIAESFIQCYGYTWFTMPLLSGQDEVDVVSDHSVRLTENYQISAVGWNLYKLSMQLEDRFVEPGPACQWCGEPYNYTTWDSEEGAWVYTGPFWGGSYTFIRPAVVGGVEWWKDPRPDALTFELMIDQSFYEAARLYINSENESVATVDLTAYDPAVWHTLTVPLNWSLDPSGNLYVINIATSPYEAYPLRLRICLDDTGQECTGN